MRCLVRFLPALLALCVTGVLQAQTTSDHVMVGKKKLMTGVSYAHDSWDKYWEGSLKRANGNLGTVTTETLTWLGIYGVNDRLNVMAFVPYVWTDASQGVLHGMDDFQDLTVAAKYRLTETALTKDRTLRTFAVASFGTPLTNYTQDFLPLSIGLQTDTFTGRGIVNLTMKSGWFVNGSLGYTFRDDTTLDRPFYFTNGTAFLTNRVEMHDVLDVSVSAGYQDDRLMVPVTYWRQDTRGGGDIRRQDMPFVSNNFDFTRIGIGALYKLPWIEGVSARVDVVETIDGRNVGDSTTLSAGLFRTFTF